jgi:vancomycin resistance protein VanJ
VNNRTDRAPRGPRRRRRFATGVVAASWLYAALIVFLLAAIHGAGERWWPVTLVLFGPRWLFLLPGVALGIAGHVGGAPSLWWLQGAIGLVVAGPFMDLSLPLARSWQACAGRTRVRILTLNQQSGRFKVDALIRIIEREKIDVICFQEMIFDPTLERYLSKGWSRDRGRCIATRLPIVEELDSSTSPYADPGLDRVRLRCGSGAEFLFAAVHGPSMRPGFNGLRAGNLRDLKQAIAARRRAIFELVAALENARGTPTIVAGDFNTPSDSPMLAALRPRCRFGFEQAGWGYGYTWPSRCPWVRIDHILASPEWAFAGCWVGPDVGSDHLPVIAEVVLHDQRK